MKLTPELAGHDMVMMYGGSYYEWVREPKWRKKKKKLYVALLRGDGEWWP